MSDTEQTQLTETQRKICTSFTSRYDDKLIDSSTMMLDNTITYPYTIQETVFSESIYDQGFTPVYRKFNQILNISNNNWMKVFRQCCE